LRRYTQARLPEWPQYCQHLAAVPHLPQAHPDLATLLGASAAERGVSQLGREEPSMMGLDGTSAGPGGVSLAGGLAGLNLGGGGDGGGGVGGGGGAGGLGMAAAVGAPPAPRVPMPPGMAPLDGAGGSDGVGRPVSGAAAVLELAALLGTVPRVQHNGATTLLQPPPPNPTLLPASMGGGAGAFGPTAPAAGGTAGFATSLNLETLLAAGSNQDISVPDSETVDKVHFIINNLSVQNMVRRCRLTL